MGAPRGTPAERLMRRVVMVPEAGCWLWTGSWNSDGYGNIWNPPKTDKAHRVSYEIHVGPIPLGMLVLHRCDTPACVNPAHLFLGTDMDNSLDKRCKGRAPSHHGTDNPNAKLTPDQVRAIRIDKRPLRLIAADYGISISMASYVRRGDHWKSVA